MKNIFSLTIVFFAALTLSGQPWMKSLNIPSENSSTSKKKLNFYQIVNEFNKYWESKTPDMEEESENEEEGGWQQFKRWEWFMGQRVYPSGNFFDSRILYHEYENFKRQRIGISQNNIAVANWTFIGPDVVPGSGGGIGRINCMAFDPSNSNTIFVGAACGGLWKSTNGGSSWQSNTDLLASLSISEIVIDPTNNQIMYLATGDKYGIYSQYEVTGHYSAGILKSTDGGTTWSPTSLSSIQSDNLLYQRLIINPTNTSILILATNNGIYRTTDAGATWTNVQSGLFYDVEFNTANPNIVYAVNGISFYISNNGGSTFTTGGGLSLLGDRSSIAVTADDANYVYVWNNAQDLYKSTNAGTSFTAVGFPNSTAGPYGYYDCVIEVSDADKNVLYAGGLNVGKSDDGGATWTTVADWSAWPAPNYTHADNHAIEFLPGSSTTTFTCNDGGIFKTTDGGTSWTDISNNLAISQFYRFANDQTNPALIYTGAQDNGTNKYDGVTWNQVFGADGMESMIDYTNPQNVYVSYQSGVLQKSTDGGATFNQIAPCFGDWVTPFEMDPVNPNIIYAACTDVYRSADGGNTFNTISAGLSSSNLICLKIAPSNSNTLYTASPSNIWKTTNGGTSWTDITSGLPASAAISFISISNIDPNKVWVSFSGYSSGNKIFYSGNGGSTWANISAGLPNVPANCLIYQNNSNDIVYCGTDFGVFYIDASMSSWQPYNTNLPNVIIDELEIVYNVSKLRAATYGRGVWESDLAISTLYANDAGIQTVISPAGIINCDSTFSAEILIRNFGVDTINSLDIFYAFDNNTFTQTIYNGTLLPGTTQNIVLGTFTLNSGSHTLNTYTSNPNGLIDNNNFNDTSHFAFTINGTIVGQTLPVNDDYENGSVNLTQFNITPAGLLSVFSGAGAFGLSNNSLKADYYSVNNATGILKMKGVDLSNALQNVILSFDLAYAPYDVTVYHDSLFVEVNDICDNVQNTLLATGDLAMATAATTTNTFIPASTEWQHYSFNLNQYIGLNSLEIIFKFQSGYGNNLYIDNINLTDGVIAVNEITDKNAFVVFPNPVNNLLTIQSSEINLNDVSIEIENCVGQKILSKQMTKSSESIQLNTALLPTGFYFVTLKSDKFSWVKKFMKQ